MKKVSVSGSPMATNSPKTPGKKQKKGSPKRDKSALNNARRPSAMLRQSTVGLGGLTGVESSDQGMDVWSKNQTRILLKPDDQLELSADDLKDDHARVLTMKYFQGPANLVEFSHREGRFILQPQAGPTVEKVNIEGFTILKDTVEAQIQMAYEAGQVHDPKVLKKKSFHSSDSAEDEDAPSKTKSEGTHTEIETPAGGDSTAVDDKKIVFRDKRIPSDIENLYGPKKVVNEFNFCEREIATYNNPMRNVLCQTVPACIKIFNDLVTQWHIYDGYEEDQVELQRIRDLENPKLKDAAKQAPVQITTKKDENRIKEKEEQESLAKLLQVAQTMERMINQNTYDDIAKDYRYWEDPADEFETEGTLLPLWKLVYEKTKTLMVTAICWNPCYYDYFAVSFGTFEFTTPVSEGSVCLFSLKNPSYPEFICFIDSGVMSVDIHPKHPDLIVTGLYDGNIALYNVQISNTPQFRSDVNSGKHGSIVWNVKWVDDTPDDEINFYTVSGDGDICNWVLMKSELCKTTITSLNILGPLVAGPYGTSVVRTRCGSYIVFHPTNPNIYLAGSEEGAIHKCSTECSISLHVYNAHTLPVHKIDYNKYYPDIFISCSADWRIKIWEDGRDEPIFVFDVGVSVGDVQWAPFSSTIFAACVQDGRVFIFDLNINKYKAICVQYVVSKRRNRLTRLAFNNKLPFLIVGDDKGCTTSLKLSPNLRKKVKPPKKGPRFTPFELEVIKLERILASVREPVTLIQPPDVGQAPL